ncbi:MAG: DUF86 domain-containing protein [Promethearchaeota archaeon]|nr:MAG: DUF86 domain-containing protein [Candidatus Lokiarchaeota archaeon]
MYNDVIEERLKKLEKIVDYLEGIKDYNIDKFKVDYTLSSALKHNLQIAIQCILDIGNHIIAIENLEKPNQYKDIFLVLGKNKIIPMAFANKINKMAGLRNILIHIYMDIDLDELISHLKKINDFKIFMKYIAEYLKNKEIKENKIK